mgnify:CR=1 FL=1
MRVCREEDVAARSKDKSEREARERTRVYRARVEMHEAGVKRRTRDNWIAGLVAGVIIVGAIGGQVAYYTVGPGTPAPPPPMPSMPAKKPTTVPRTRQASTNSVSGKNILLRRKNRYQNTVRVQPAKVDVAQTQTRVLSRQ